MTNLRVVIPGTEKTHYLHFKKKTLPDVHECVHSQQIKNDHVEFQYDFKACCCGLPLPKQVFISRVLNLVTRKNTAAKLTSSMMLSQLTLVNTITKQ